MLGVALLFVGFVLINNGAARWLNFDKKPTAVVNIFVGLLSVTINVITLVQADGITANFYSAGTGLLFGFTYLFIALNNIFEWDLRPYGVYSLLVAIVAIPAAYVSYTQGDMRMCAIWIAWSVLWATGFIETVLKKDLGNFVSFLLIGEGIFTALIPGFLMLVDKW